MLPVLHIGPLAIQFPGLILLLGLWLGLSLAEHLMPTHLQRYAVDKDGSQMEHYQVLTAPLLYNLAVGSLLSGIMGARLVYILQYTQPFLDNPISMISLNTSLLDPRGALLGAVVFALYYGQRKKFTAWHVLDALTPALAVLAIAFHLANLASGKGFGSPAQIPWGISLWGVVRHPVQLYEAATAAGFLWWVWASQKKKSLSQPGEYFLYFIAFSAGSRLLWEAFHGDSQLLAGGIRTVQMVAWLVLAASIYLLKRLETKPADPGAESTIVKGEVDHGG